MTIKYLQYQSLIFTPNKAGLLSLHYWSVCNIIQKWMNEDDRRRGRAGSYRMTQSGAGIPVDCWAVLNASSVTCQEEVERRLSFFVCLSVSHPAVSQFHGYRQFHDYTVRTLLPSVNTMWRFRFPFCASPSKKARRLPHRAKLTGSTTAAPYYQAVLPSYLKASNSNWPTIWWRFDLVCLKTSLWTPFSCFHIQRL